MNFSERFNQTNKSVAYSTDYFCDERFLSALWRLDRAGPLWSSDHDPVHAAVPPLPRPQQHLRADENVQCGVRGEGGHYACSTCLWTPRCCLTLWCLSPSSSTQSSSSSSTPSIATRGRTFTTTRAALSAAYPQCRNRNIAGTRGPSSRERRSGGNRLRTVWPGGSGEGGAAHDHNIRRQTADRASDATEALHTNRGQTYWPSSNLLPQFLKKYTKN